jgi:hypothetical protein
MQFIRSPIFRRINSRYSSHILSSRASTQLHLKEKFSSNTNPPKINLDRTKPTPVLGVEDWIQKKKRNKELNEKVDKLQEIIKQKNLDVDIRSDQDRKSEESEVIEEDKMVDSPDLQSLSLQKAQSCSLFH